MTLQDKIKLAAEYRRTHGTLRVEKFTPTWWKLQQLDGETLDQCMLRERLV
jgi:hypothetical protein